MRRRTFIGAFAASVAAASARAEELHPDWPEAAADAEISEALNVLEQWIALYREGDYLGQWRLTDPRIRRWFGRRRWRDTMRAAHRRNGDLLDYDIGAYAATSAADLPCTEMGHCFRARVPYVFALVRTRYVQANPAQPEYCVAAHSSEGWRFGGGTLLNRPLGETAVILSQQDERRYTPRFVVTP